MKGAGSTSSVRAMQADVVELPQMRPEVPSDLERVAAGLALFPRVCESAYRLVVRQFGTGPHPAWPEFVATLGDRGILEGVDGDDSYACAAEWRPRLDAVLCELGGTDMVRSGLVSAWLEQPDEELVEWMCAWAAELGLWDALERIWILLGEQAAGPSSRCLQLFGALPTEARHARPILTWASAAAATLLAGDHDVGGGIFWERLLLDSAMLHADWAVQAKPDQAVEAGTFRMLGERRLPATHAGQSLDAAWRTKEAIDQLIDARSRAGYGPSRAAQAVFRAFSARLALFRYDPTGAISEARWAGILSDWRPVAVMAKGIESLTNSVSTEDGPINYSDPPIVGMTDPLGVYGLRGMGELYEILADGHEALRRLDREGVDRSLAVVTPQTAAVAGVWAVRVALQAWRDALWGDLAEGLASVTHEVQQLSRQGREADEPLGKVLLNRTRVVLLVRAGAFAAAARVAEALPEEVRLVSMARIHLWAGQYAQANRIADVGPYQPGLEILDRYRLVLIRVAAAILEGSLTKDLQRDATREVARIVESENFIYLALLPPAARKTLLDLGLSGVAEHDPRVSHLRQRLAQLNDHNNNPGRPFHLTERELVLLPLLATEHSVPVIAAKLQVSVNTVRKQVHTLLKKFEVHSRADLIRKARTFGAIP